MYRTYNFNKELRRFLSSSHFCALPAVDTARSLALWKPSVWLTGMRYREPSPKASETKFRNIGGHFEGRRGKEGGCFLHNINIQHNFSEPFPGMWRCESQGDCQRNMSEI